MQPVMGGGVVVMQPVGQPIYFKGTQRSFVFNPRMPHVKPMCYKCQNTHINYRKMKPCSYCVCKKCGGDGVIQEKGGKICKKMKLKD
jgi:hypothetical protein